MKVRATQSNTYPPGCHWSVGKVRDITLAEGEELPSWLVEVKAGKAGKATKTSKPKKDEPAAVDEG